MHMHARQSSRIMLAHGMAFKALSTFATDTPYMA